MGPVPAGFMVVNLKPDIKYPPLFGWVSGAAREWSAWICRAIFLLLVIIPSLVRAENLTPIRYKVDSNNRIFASGEHERYVGDLNWYLRCIAYLPNSQPADKSPECNAYRAKGTTESKVVPDLRQGEIHREYKTQYNKVRQKYSRHYALDKRRKIVLFLDDVWIRSQTSVPVKCDWTVSAGAERKYLSAEGCKPAMHEVELTLSEAGKVLSWTASAQVNVELSGGAKMQFETPVLVRDFLIVAMGDSFTSGEGNPERNHTQTTPAQWLDYRCHRSLFSYPVMLATTLTLADPRHSVTLIHVACSGATATEGVLGKYKGAIKRKQAVALWRGPLTTHGRRIDVPQEWKRYGTEAEDLEPQVTQVRTLLGDGERARKPDLLLMSIGVQ